MNEQILKTFRLLKSSMVRSSTVNVLMMLIYFGILGLAKNSTAAVLFHESFEDTNFTSRGWYDVTGGATTGDHVDGVSAFDCRFLQGGNGCANGGPGRHLFDVTDTVYLSYYVKYSSNYVGSGLGYHPHELYLLTNKDDAWIGPAGTHLTMYVERNYQHPRLAMQDMLNVDTHCIRRNDGSWSGVSGCSANYPFTESRSVASCNGIAGDSGIGDCFQWDATNWYSARLWDATINCFSNSGQYNQNSWNHVEVYFKMNSIQNGIGIADGEMKYRFNGETIINYTHILYRTGANADMKFNQLIIGPYIGDGSPVDQRMWIDNLTVANADVPSSDTTPPAAPSGLSVL